MPSAAPTARRLPAGTLYRGREGMWSWVAHRVTGVLIFFFLFVHVLDTALIRVSPDAYNDVIASYKHPIMSVMELGLTAAILFHALNGIRIVLVDFWSKGTKYQAVMLRVIVVLWVALMVPSTYYLLKHAFLEVFGS
ncbi:succinate dehydrogenase, cytochrome b556 subunit [Cryptosporangium phraense]|uniref:Succinate dehydrogenase, cytochrome b556 subunit n=1 Tax=Cryptosporangium phraense TaxID=2593070 RepID=A0A545AUF6_9ACTN|nr:succinate dehydrogenase, cytochrome b556 subunit [Cryptosporangium phraense]TQS44952.1 succinate dehydrogenase, cytochrome b556 subunit [Cryptosporangium phraense]